MALHHRMLNVLLRRAWTGQFSAIPCSHLDMINDVEPSSQVCDQCVALGETWPELRMCLICGHVGCCEDSRYQHARRHFEATGHPLIMPYGARGWTGSGVMKIEHSSTRSEAPTSLHRSDGG